MRKRKHLPFCLNCNTALTETDNYCPVCGQENYDKKVPILAFIADFFSNYLSLDSTFFRTVPVFLYKPGTLTNVYNAGQRRVYLNPIRLYLVMSLFYFFAVSLIIPRNFFDQLMTGQFPGILDTTEAVKRPEVQNALNPQEKAELDSLLQVARARNPMLLSGLDTLSAKLTDSSTGKISWKELKLLAQDPQVSDSSFALAIESSDLKFIDFMGVKGKRNFVANSNLFMMSFARNLPLMMLFLLPFFALILKLLYIRRPWYYVEHLIHGLHLHSFAYLIYGIGIILIHFKLGGAGWITAITFLIVSVYAFISLIRVYRQGWFKVLIKFNILGFIYFFLFWVALGYELYLSLKYQ